jgi:hypothetical protein
MKGGLVLASLIAVSILVTPVFTSCKEPEPSTPPLSAQEIIDNSARSMEAVNSFHFEIMHTGGGTPMAMGLEMNEAVGDVSKPGRLKTAITAAMGKMLIEVEVITIGTTTYMTNPLTREWELLPNEFSAINIFDLNTGIIAILQDVRNPVKLEDEGVAGIGCYHLKGEVPCESLRPITLSSIEGVMVSVDVWIDKAEFLIRQVKLEGRITETEKEGIVRELKLSEFNQEIEIEPPG